MSDGEKTQQEAASDAICLLAEARALVECHRLGQSVDVDVISMMMTTLAEEYDADDDRDLVEYEIEG